MWNKQSSFTLIEVLIAVFLITVAIGGTFILMQRVVEYSAVSFSRLQAVYLAQEGIEQVRNQRDSNWLAGNPWNQGIGNRTDTLGKFTRILTIETPTLDKMVVSVSVDWSERGRSHSVTAQTELYNWK